MDMVNSLVASALPVWRLETPPAPTDSYLEPVCLSQSIVLSLPPIPDPYLEFVYLEPAFPVNLQN